MTETIEDIALESIDTGVTGTDENDSIKISHRAIDVIKKVREDNKLTDEYYLRFAVRGGGCSGMAYAIGFDNEVHDTDKIYDVKDFKIIVDNKSLFYFMGVTLDYTNGPEGSGFIFKNPGNFQSCGCHA